MQHSACTSSELAQSLRCPAAAAAAAAALLLRLAATADFSSAKLGTVKQVGNGLYEYTAFPGISNQDEHEVFAVTVTDGRGGSAAAQLTVVVRECAATGQRARANSSMY